MKNLILIIGSGRSGTSLLRSILIHHEEISFFGNELNSLWFPDFYPDTKIKNDLIPKFHEDPISFTIFSIFKKNFITKLIHELFFLIVKFKLLKKHFLIKSPLLTFMLPIFLLKFKKIKIINITRNKNDIFNSFVKKNFHKKYSDEQNLNEFKKNVDNHIKSINFYLTTNYIEKLKDKKKFLEISYENLTNDTEQTLLKIKNFCELSKDIDVPKDIVIRD